MYRTKSELDKHVGRLLLKCKSTTDVKCRKKKLIFRKLIDLIRFIFIPYPTAKQRVIQAGTSLRWHSRVWEREPFDRRLLVRVYSRLIRLADKGRNLRNGPTGLAERDQMLCSVLVYFSSIFYLILKVLKLDIFIYSDHSTCHLKATRKY